MISLVVLEIFEFENVDARTVQVPTWHAIARSENVLHYCPFKLEITVLLPNYIYSHVTYHVTRQ